MEFSFCPKEQIAILKKFTSHLTYQSVVKIYQGTRDGFGAKDFHRMCDNMEGIFILIKANNYIFGGYCSKSFKSRSGWICDNESFAFSLSNPENKPTYFKCVAPDNSFWDSNQNHFLYFCVLEVILGNSYGPCFGNGSDISIEDNCNENEKSYSNIEMAYVGK